MQTRNLSGTLGRSVVERTAPTDRDIDAVVEQLTRPPKKSWAEWLMETHEPSQNVEDRRTTSRYLAQTNARLAEAQRALDSALSSPQRDRPTIDRLTAARNEAQLDVRAAEAEAAVRTTIGRVFDELTAAPARKPGPTTTNESAQTHSMIDQRFNGALKAVISRLGDSPIRQAWLTTINDARVAAHRFVAEASANPRDVQSALMTQVGQLERASLGQADMNSDVLSDVVRFAEVSAQLGDRTACERANEAMRSFTQRMRRQGPSEQLDLCEDFARATRTFNHLAQATPEHDRLALKDLEQIHDTSLFEPRKRARLTLLARGVGDEKTVLEAIEATRFSNLPQTALFDYLVAAAKKDPTFTSRSYARSIMTQLVRDSGHSGKIEDPFDPKWVAFVAKRVDGLRAERRKEDLEDALNSWRPNEETELSR